MFSPQHTLLCRYRYDPLDRLISHAQSTAPRNRFYCKTRLVTEIQGALRHSIVQHGDLLLAQQQHESDAFGTTLLATDLQRSVLHTLEKNTGRQPIAYSPYGHRSAESGLISLVGFNGERPDPVTGHYLLGNGYRAFNPVLMRFNSPDSWSPFGKGGLNIYSYCLGNPITGTDPSGKIPLIPKFVTKIFNYFKEGAKKSSNAGSTLGEFEKIQNMPDILENIIQRLPGADMASLAQTSSGMKNIVYKSPKKLPPELTEIGRIERKSNGQSTMIPRPGYDSSTYYIYSGDVERIGSGRIPGILPVQLGAHIDLSIEGGSIRKFVPELATDARFKASRQHRKWTIKPRT